MGPACGTPSRTCGALPYLLRSWWQGPRRIKQYEGPHRRSLGGYTLDIDSDRVYAGRAR